ncbi:hypothetical protein GCM10025876_11800 [Demequina litorisediminis]|uniref:Isoprenyl transferase n=1 Tax=Demequina litorisediminis TaxID=1849022 RepID=A0ABQ6IBA6_9MICO|nr:hypothetical protein GCM10025876_11800 [Demequina litorisediminis]
MGLRSLLYKPYERDLERTLRTSGQTPRHIGVILDGNRRWAKQSGASAADGHRRGADKISEVLGWSEEPRRRGRHPVDALHRQPWP